jgi:hypothetical protein
LNRPVVASNVVVDQQQTGHIIQANQFAPQSGMQQQQPTVVVAQANLIGQPQVGVVPTPVPTQQQTAYFNPYAPPPLPAPTVTKRERKPLLIVDPNTKKAINASAVTTNSNSTDNAATSGTNNRTEPMTKSSTQPVISSLQNAKTSNTSDANLSTTAVTPSPTTTSVAPNTNAFKTVTTNTTTSSNITSTNTTTSNTNNNGHSH